ncbi:MAG TPA: hypothetical protein VFN99_11110 [Gaiella sp.]|nr:hypothetical protein [Gaiella sp.]
MRRLVALSAAGIVSVSLVAGGQAASAPTLRVVTETPLVVRGTAFRPSERVTVTALTLLGPERVVVRASRLGTFRARLRELAQPCGRAFAVRAVGARGSRAALSLRGAPCIPPPID